MDAIRLTVHHVIERRGRRFPRPVPQRDRAEHASTLRQQLQDAVDGRKKELADRDPSLPTVPPGVQLLLEPARDKGGRPMFGANDVPKGWQLEVAEERPDGALVTLLPKSDPSALVELVEAWGRDERDEKGAALEGTGKVGHIERFVRRERTDRMGEALAALDLSVEGLHVVDVELRAGDCDPEGAGRRGDFRRYVIEAGGSLIDGQIVAADYAVFRACLPSKFILDLLDYRWDVLSIDLPPRLELEYGELNRNEEDAPFPEIRPRRAGTPVIGVIDGGVVSAQPLLRAALEGLPHRSWVPTDAATDVAADDAQHGCAVASLAALGSLRDALVRQNEPIDPISVCVARVLGAQAQLPETLNLPATLPGIVEYLREQAGARIVNHSIASTALFRESRMSVWAERIDHLVFDDGHDGVLFIVATGNVDGVYSPSEGWLAENAARYPDYLLDSRCRLRDPAQAINALTVGGYVPEAAALWHSRVTLGIEPLAGDGGISPLSRTGPGYADAIKPDVVEEAGNYYRDGSGGLNRTARVTDVAVANPSWLSDGRQVRFTQGTSFAAPKVAHFAGCILVRLPTASPDLLKALIVNSAEWPTPVPRAERENALRLFGYGVPRPKRVFEIAGPRTVLFVTEAIPIRFVHYFEIPFPRELFEDPTRTIVRVSITLAYRAPVRRKTKRYRGTVLEWTLSRRGETMDQIRARFPRNTDEVEDAEGDDDEATTTSVPPAQVDEPAQDWPWIIGVNPRTRGTTQKDWFDAPAAWFGDSIMVGVAGRRGWMSKKDAESFKQRYSMAISIEAIGEVVALHESIKARIKARVNTSVRIKEP